MSPRTLAIRRRGKRQKRERELAVIVSGDLSEKSLASLALVGGTSFLPSSPSLPSSSNSLLPPLNFQGTLKRLCIEDNEEVNGTCTEDYAHDNDDRYDDNQDEPS